MTTRAEGREDHRPGLTTLDRNLEILHELARGVGSAVQDVGSGARQAVGELGTGAGRAVQEVGSGAGAAVRDVGQGAGAAVQDVGRGAGAAVQEVGEGTGGAVQDKRESTSRTDRTHLPNPVVPGQEYEDVTVTYRLATRLTGEPEAGRNGDNDTAG
ncbi:hypothetical protein ACFVOK_23565 [Streptomyces sp. NPDC057798]|uniref:hypothetical protein n=1 Tax=Streptomyces sp. NPDC057798 TaxID=3346252 RepID=UPI003691F818